jgi:hypothetical protein
MDLIADMLLLSGCVGAVAYCAVLARRLSRFSDLEKGMGGAIAVLSVQVDDMTRALSRAQTAAGASREDLSALTERAEAATKHLELLLAAMHDLPSAPAVEASPATEPKPEEPEGWRSRRPLRRVV